MVRLNNDYNRGAYPEVLAAIADINGRSFAGYGDDEICDKAEGIIKKLCKKPEAKVFFFPGATQANFIVCKAALLPTQSVICPQSGHINCHEAASIENTGHKILAAEQKNGKIEASQIDRICREYEEHPAEYYTEPKLVYISFPTEMGTLYSKKELSDISDTCKKHGLYLFIDGARLGYGLACAQNDVSLCELADLADVFYIGGTKCGALFGEALVICNKALQYRFKSYMKQNGAVLAKGFILGAQFKALLENGLYFEGCKRADELAMIIKDAFAKKGIPFWVDSPTNQQFVILDEKQAAKLAKNYIFEDNGRTGDGKMIARFCTAWNTGRDEVQELARFIGNEL